MFRDLDRLTNWALVSFTARCAERALFVAGPPELDRPTFARGLQTALAAAAGDLAARREAFDIARGVDRASVQVSNAIRNQDIQDISNSVGLATWSAGVANYPERRRDLYTHAFLVVRQVLHPFRSDPRREAFVFSSMRDDLRSLITAIRTNRWTNDDPVPDTVYATVTRFDLLTPVHDGKHIVQVCALLDAQLAEYVLTHPKDLYRLGSRQFEQLIAELFAGFGFEVQLTRPTRDGGRDIIAVSSRPVGVKYLIEAKKYGADQRVGVAAARSLLGVVSDEKASKGIIATTAPAFTGEAKRLFERNTWRLEGRAFDDIIRWLREYDASRLARSMGRLPQSHKATGSVT